VQPVAKSTRVFVNARIAELAASQGSLREIYEGTQPQALLKHRHVMRRSLR
jgi:hypothetical protein